MTYRLFPATYRNSLIRDSSGQWFVKSKSEEFDIISLTALTVNTSYALNQLRTRPEIITSVECDHGVLLVPEMRVTKSTHAQDEINCDLNGAIKWKSSKHALVKIPCPFGAMCQFTRKPVFKGESNKIVRNILG